MKLVRLMIVMLILVISVLACQIPGTSSTEATEAPAGQQTGYPPASSLPTPYPEPASYPSPQAAMEQVLALYPDLEDGADVTWEQAMGIIGYGVVTKVMQTHDMKVYLTLEDGRTFVTVEPAIDDIIRLIEECGETCKDIKVATE